jgi:hypothetical protein
VDDPECRNRGRHRGILIPIHEELQSCVLLAGQMNEAELEGLDPVNGQTLQESFMRANRHPSGVIPGGEGKK